ncbi:hypothetical protein Pelo_2340 [Pelomyxa schiedti]|nr:hypothetical protein Pelo_2340 [Pelomyxa schiedti]
MRPESAVKLVSLASACLVLTFWPPPPSFPDYSLFTTKELRVLIRSRNGIASCFDQQCFLDTWKSLEGQGTTEVAKWHALSLAVQACICTYLVWTAVKAQRKFQTLPHLIKSFARRSHLNTDIGHTLSWAIPWLILTQFALSASLRFLKRPTITVSHEEIIQRSEESEQFYSLLYPDEWFELVLGKLSLTSSDLDYGRVVCGMDLLTQTKDILFLTMWHTTCQQLESHRVTVSGFLTADLTEFSNPVNSLSRTLQVTGSSTKNVFWGGVLMALGIYTFVNVIWPLVLISNLPKALVHLSAFKGFLHVGTEQQIWNEFQASFNKKKGKITLDATSYEIYPNWLVDVQKMMLFSIADIPSVDMHHKDFFTLSDQYYAQIQIEKAQVEEFMSIYLENSGEENSKKLWKAFDAAKRDYNCRRQSPTPDTDLELSDDIGFLFLLERMKRIEAEEEANKLSKKLGKIAFKQAKKEPIDDSTTTHPQCKLCQANSSEFCTFVTPSGVCGHVVCVTCAEKVTFCPYCRGEKLDVSPVFL